MLLVRFKPLIIYYNSNSLLTIFTLISCFKLFFMRNLFFLFILILHSTTICLGQKNGYIIEKYPNGKTKYEGQFTNGKPVGLIKRYDNKGKLSSTLNYEKNTDLVAAHHYHANGKILSKGNYLNQKKWKKYY